MRIKIIYISVQGKSIGNIQNYEALEGVYWTYIEIIWQKQEKNGDNWSSTSTAFSNFLQPNNTFLELYTFFPFCHSFIY